MSPVLLLAALAAALAPAASASPADSVLTAAGAIALPGVTDAADAMKLDHSVLVGNLLFLACKENNTVSVVDLDAGAFVTSTVVPTPQGLAYSAALGMVFVASSSAGTLSALSAAPPFAVAWSIAVGGDCDNIRCVDTPGGAAPARVYVAHGGGAAGNGAVTAVDASLAGGAVAFTTDVGSDHPEELNLSPLANVMTVSVPAAAGGGVRVLSTDPARPRLDFWSGEGLWSGPFAQTVDASGQRLWLATAGAVEPPIASQLLALNALDGTLLFAAPTGEAGAACDEIALDEAGGLVFAAKGGPASRLYVVRQTRASAAFPGVGANWTALGSLDGMPQSLVNARGVVWRASTRTLYLKVPLDAAAKQPAQLLVFAAAAAPAPAAAPGGGACDQGALGQGAWSALTAGVALVGLVVGIALARNVGVGGAKEAKDAAYASLN